MAYFSHAVFYHETTARALYPASRTKTGRYPRERVTKLVYVLYPLAKWFVDIAISLPHTRILELAAYSRGGGECFVRSQKQKL